MHKKILVSLCGYQNDMNKVALCITNAGSFSVVDDVNKKTVFSGVLSDPVISDEMGETVRAADFSRLSESGRYYIKCGFRRSDTFEISDNVCGKLRDLLVSGIYLNRCGFDFGSDGKELAAESRRYEHPACHTDMVPMYFGGGRIDASGGWHCGGGYGKSVFVTAFACAYMLWSMKLFGDSIDGSISDECRWGIEWLLKMQAPDGGVYHKCDTACDSSWPDSPVEDKSEYFIFPKSSQATMLFTAVTALAAKVYEKSDTRFSRLLGRAATNGWIWIVNSPDFEPWELPSGASPNGIADVPDPDRSGEYMWVLSEMYSLTGDELFEKKYLDQLYKTETSGFSPGHTGGFAALSYIMGEGHRDASALFYIKKKFGDKADRIISAGTLISRGKHLCLLPVPDQSDEYSNIRVLSDCLTCQAAYMIFGTEKYLRTAECLFQYIAGRNPMGISYITGSAESSPKRPYHALSSSGNFGVPVPGMLVSGPNYANRDGYSMWLLKQDTPPFKCYIDSEYSRSNEPAVCYGAAAIMAASFFESCSSAAFEESLNR